MFGIRSSTSSFQMLIEAVTEETKQPGFYAYQNDIVIVSDCFKETCKKYSPY